MKSIAVLCLALCSLLFVRHADAQNLFLCCDTAARPDGSCVSQATACPEPLQYGISLTDIPGNGWSGIPVTQAYTTASFPSGVGGYMSWNGTGPWVGFCLDAPSASDPTHERPTEPIGCLSLSLAPGVGGEIAQVEFPVSPRWDAYQLCYGAPTGSGSGCSNPNDLNDPTVSPTPSGSSCCGPSQLLRAPENLAVNPANWQILLGQEIPGVPPPVVIYGPDGGIVIDYQPDAGDYFGGVPDACAKAYNEPASCGAPAGDSAVPTESTQSISTPDASGGASATVTYPDGSSPDGSMASAGGGGSGGGCSIGLAGGEASRGAGAFLWLTAIGLGLRRVKFRRLVGPAARSGGRSAVLAE